MAIIRRTVLCLSALGLFGRGISSSAAAGTGVMLAREAPEGLDPTGYWVSEKYDGVRALWDGQQLRFRSGLPVQAPIWFTAALPAQALDGELWLGRGRFEAVCAVVRKHEPITDEWQSLRYQVFDMPGVGGEFQRRLAHLQAAAHESPSAMWSAAPQWRLANNAALVQCLQDVVRGGGEGLVLHRSAAIWRPGRSDDLLKLKPLNDGEAVVVRYEAGQGKHAGRLGALVVRTVQGQEIRLGTGLTDAERSHPPALGSTVTFTYRGLTAGGVPRFASFLRLHPGI